MITSKRKAGGRGGDEFIHILQSIPPTPTPNPHKPGRPRGKVRFSWSGHERAQSRQGTSTMPLFQMHLSQKEELA